MILDRGNAPFGQPNASAKLSLQMGSGHASSGLWSGAARFDFGQGVQSQWDLRVREESFAAPGPKSYFRKTKIVLK
jgi:hypothetical protein